MTAFNRALERTLQAEGWYTDDGPTYLGIDRRYWPEWSGWAVVGFRLWRGADPYTLVAEFPGWASGGRWTQETPIASGEAFTLTAVFAGPVGVWTDASCSDEQYTEQATCEAADATWTAGSCSVDGYPTEAECEGTESPRSAVYVYPMGDGTPGIRHARFKTVAWVTAAPLTNQTGARLR